MDPFNAAAAPGILPVDRRDRRRCDALLTEALGWHAGPFKAVFTRALGRIAQTFPSGGFRVLEIGASPVAAPSLYFLARGCPVLATHFDPGAGAGLRAFTAKVCHRHGIATDNLAIRRLDIFDGAATGETFDLILLKAVFGGLSRNHDMERFRQALLACARILNPGGLVLIVDKGWCSGLHTWILERLGAAGRNHWHYFSQAELLALAQAVPLAAPTVYWAGFLSLGVAPGPIQAALDGLDRCCFNGVLPQRGTVFSAVFQKTGDDRPD
jgi:SAM-dependent methyltransferase